MAVLNDRRRATRGQSRRRTPRWCVDRTIQIHINEPPGRVEPLMLIGRTYDMSATGLSIQLPALDCDIQDLFDGPGPLEVVISTTPTLIRVKATPVHCETIVHGLPDKSASIGMRIEQEDSGYSKYLEYLSEFQ
jgi:hypothetical protein